MASTLLIKSCTIASTANAVTIVFSDAVDTSAVDTGVTNPDNFTFYDPALPGFAVPTNPDPTWTVATSTTTLADDTVTWTLPDGTSFNPGDFVLITVSNIALAGSAGTPALVDDPSSFSRVVPGADNVGRTAKDVEDAVSYPVLTEEIGYRPSPVGIPTGGGGGLPAGGAGGSVGAIALKAVTDVLGWKANADDPKGFVGALTQSFTLTEVEGHVQSAWTPRTYAVQTDLGGGITGAQASLYMRAKDALDQSLSLLDGLYPLDPEADPEYVKALREMARSQMTEIVRELGTVGLPSILRINTYFDILLGQHDPTVEFDPDLIEGTLGDIRETYGIKFRGNQFNNSVADEQDITNFRVISDYMTSLLQSWIANRNFFRLGTTDPAFFGTQLVLISRQFNVISETVNEVRFTLDSVFIGPNERQALLLEFTDSDHFPPMFLEDVLNEVEKFATDEGPRLLRDGGKISVTNNLLPVVDTLAGLINQAHAPANAAAIPDGYRTARVQKSLDDLEDQLNQLITLIIQVEQSLPPSEDSIAIESVFATQDQAGATVNVAIFGRGFTFDSQVTVFSTTPLVIPQIFFSSAERIDVSFDPPPPGSHDIVVTKPDGEFSTFVNAFIIAGSAGGGVLVTAKRDGGGGGGGAAKSMLRRNHTTASGTLARTISGTAARKASIASATAPGLPPASKTSVPAFRIPAMRPVGSPVRTVPPSATLGVTAPGVTSPGSGSGPAASAAVKATDVQALHVQMQQLQTSHQQLAQDHKTVISRVEEVAASVKGLEESIVNKLKDLLEPKKKGV